MENWLCGKENTVRGTERAKVKNITSFRTAYEDRRATFVSTDG